MRSNFPARRGSLSRNLAPNNEPIFMSARNQEWIIETGDDVVKKRAARGELTPLEELIYCLWIADYSMRNAGDLRVARDRHPRFLEEGKAWALSSSDPR